jgi:hypothetical protein
MTKLRFIEPLPTQRFQESNEGAFSGASPAGWTVRARQNLHQTQMDIAENMRASINRRIEQFSALQQETTRVIAGYQYVYDPIDQKVYDVMVGVKSAPRGDGYVYRTNSGLTPPRLGLHRLEPLG